MLYASSSLREKCNRKAANNKIDRSGCDFPPTPGNGTFDFLGIIHYWGKSRRGYWIIKRRTVRKRLRAAIESTIGAIKRPFGNDKLPVRGKFRMEYGDRVGGKMVNLRRIQRFQAQRRKKTRKQTAGNGTKAPLFSFFNRILAFFLSQFYSVTRFSILHP